MPDLDFWNNARDIRALAHIAERQRITFSLRGSVAEVVVDHYSTGKTFDSLLGVLPPFCDLDFLVDTHAAGRILESELAKELPSSRFFRIDVLTPNELERYRNSNLVVENLPRVVFGGASDVGERDLVLRWETDGEVKLWKGASLMPPTVKRGDREVNVADALNDIAYVARRHPDLLNSDPLQDLRNALIKRPREAVAQTRGHRRRKLLFTLVKLLLARATHGWDPFSDWLDDPVWEELESRHKNRRLWDVVKLIRRPSKDIVAAAVPRRKGNVWLSEIELVEESKMGPVQIELDEKASSTSINGRMSPIRIATDEPERPGCCRYRDFSRGVAEIGWAGPNRSLNPHQPDDAPFTMIGQGDDIFLAPTLRSSDGQQHAARIDYGFICQLTGEAKLIEIHHAGADDAE